MNSTLRSAARNTANIIDNPRKAAPGRAPTAARGAPRRTSMAPGLPLGPRLAQRSDAPDACLIAGARSVFSG